MHETAEATIRAYYDALRAGEPIHPFFAEDGPVVKVGIGERMIGADTVAAGLREQTEATVDWEVESRDLQVGTVGVDGRTDAGTVGVDDRTDAGRGDGGDSAFAWFGDDVFMAWTDTERSIRFEFDTRWSGALVRMTDAEDGEDREGREGREDAEDGSQWRFVEMHVSTAGET